MPLVSSGKYCSVHACYAALKAQKCLSPKKKVLEREEGSLYSQQCTWLL